MNIIPRKDWLTRQPRSRSTFTGAVSKLFVHHTVTKPVINGTFAQDMQHMRQVQEVGFDRGFYDISYSFLIMPSGRVVEGRGVHVVGGHTEGHNRSSYGICFAGNYENLPVLDRQVEAFRQLVAWLKSNGYVTADATIRPHRAMKATACPGQNIINRWMDLISSDEFTPAPPRPEGAYPGLIRRGDKGPHVRAVQEALGITVDGDFGPLTENAVKDFQRRNKLTVDGLVGKNTWNALFQEEDDLTDEQAEQLTWALKNAEKAVELSFLAADRAGKILEAVEKLDLGGLEGNLKVSGSLKVSK